MTTELIITNGDSAASRLKEAGITATIQPWRDILHDGPVPVTHDLPMLSQIRADHIRAQGWANNAHASFTARDTQLANHTQYDVVTLWFEHDLYDQLQLIQILDWFAHNPRSSQTLRLVQADDYLGDAEPTDIDKFITTTRPVTAADLETAQHVWAAFRQLTPETFADFLNADTSPLPYLHSAMVRMLEELPAPQSGLNRTEATILNAISNGVQHPIDLFVTCQESEAHRFMGDTSFFAILDRLSDAKNPALSGQDYGPYDPTWPYHQQPQPDSGRQPMTPEEDPRGHYLNAKLSLTSTGRETAACKRDFTADNIVDRWWGGTHLTNANLWRWDTENQRLLAP